MLSVHSFTTVSHGPCGCLLKIQNATDNFGARGDFGSGHELFSLTLCRLSFNLLV